MGMLYLHNDIFLTDIIGYDRLNFSKIYTPKMKSCVRHWLAYHSYVAIGIISVVTFCSLMR